MTKIPDSLGLGTSLFPLLSSLLLVSDAVAVHEERFLLP